MLKRVDVAVYRTIQDQVLGRFTPGVVEYGLAVDGVGYSTSGGFVDDIAEQLDEIKLAIVTGEIVVPTAP